MDNQTLVSVVMPVFNRAACLESVIEAFLKEKEIFCPDMEIIVIDGGSKDGSVEILEKYASRLAYWVSEPDEGPGDAFRKGVLASRGRYIRYFAADDELVQGSTPKLVQWLEQNPEYDIVSGQLESLRVLPDGSRQPRPVAIHRGHATAARLREPNRNGFICPETCVMRKTIFSRAGHWDDRFGILCDLEFFIRVLKKGGKIYSVPDMVMVKLWCEDSLTTRFKKKSIRDGAAVIRHHYGFFWGFKYWLAGNSPALLRGLEAVMDLMRRVAASGRRAFQPEGR